MNRYSRLVTTGLVMTVLLTAGCGNSDLVTTAPSDVEATSAAATASSEASNASGEANASETGNASGTAAAAETAAESSTVAAPANGTDTDSLPDTLEEGEEALSDSAGVMIVGEGEIPDKMIVWADVTAEYPDAVGWIVIPGTRVDAVITAGSSDITLDSGNSTDFTDPDTILHGTIDAGSDLESLTAFGDSQVFGDKPYIYVYTIDGRLLEYRAFAAYSGEEEDILTGHNVYDYDEFNAYIDDVYAQRDMSANFDTSIQDEVKSNWQILTIQAADGDRDYYVMATMTGAATLRE